MAGSDAADYSSAPLPAVLRSLLQLDHAHRDGASRSKTRNADSRPSGGLSAQVIFRLQTIERWGFDPEILFIAQKLGYDIREVPVTWGHDERSRISYLKDGMKMLEEMARDPRKLARRTLRRGDRGHAGYDHDGDAAR